MELNIKGKFGATEGITVRTKDGGSIDFIKGDIMAHSENGVTVLEYEVKEFTKDTLALQLKTFIGVNVLSGGLITIGNKTSESLPL